MKKQYCNPQISAYVMMESSVIMGISQDGKYDPTKVTDGDFR